MDAEEALLHANATYYITDGKGRICGGNTCARTSVLLIASLSESHDMSTRVDDDDDSKTYLN